MSGTSNSRKSESQLDRLRNILRARRSSGPTCGWCEAAAQDYEAEYGIDHDASADLLMIANDVRAECRAGLHMTEERFRQRFSYHGVTRWPDWHRAEAPC